VKIGNVVAAALTATIAPAVGVASVVRVVNARSTCAEAATCPTPEAPRPPLVAVHGFCHLDVVQHVDHGWVGTVRHGRVLGAASVAWHHSFARAELGDVASRLRLIQRRA